MKLARLLLDNLNNSRDSSMLVAGVMKDSQFEQHRTAYSLKTNAAESEFYTSEIVKSSRSIVVHANSLGTWGAITGWETIADIV